MLLSTPHRLILALCSAIWVGLCLLPLNHWLTGLLAWFGFVPLLFAIEGLCCKRTYLITLLFACISQVIASYWAIDMFVHMKELEVSQALGYAIIVWFYMAHVFVAIFLLQAWLVTRLAVSRVIVLPVVATTLLWLWPLVFPISFAETQFDVKLLVLPASITGAWGLDALIFTVNACVYEWLRGRLSRAQLISVVMVLVLWIGAGVLLAADWQNSTYQAQRLSVGLIQPNTPPDASGNKIESGYVRSHRLDMELSEKLITRSEEPISLLVWPEGRPKHFRHDAVANKAISEFANEHDVWLAFQDSSKNIDGVYNQSILLDSDGQERHSHNKVKPMPFGEYMPLAEYLPDEGRQVRRFFTRLDSNFDAGESYSTWPADALMPGLTIIPMICYENVFAKEIAQAIPNEIGRYLMISQTNDVWFGETIQPFMHNRKAAMRAVENGVVMVNAVQNGPSAVYLPDASVHFQSRAFEAGAYRVEVPIHSAKPSFYSRYPLLFSYAMLALFIGLVLAALRPKHQAV